MTIESAIPKAGGGKDQVDGMGMMHQCKSWVCYFTEALIIIVLSPIIARIKRLDGCKPTIG
ncbi:hypothetical protein CJF30_00010063 [Rutstroemia sp. NJR-2017a BBW]|nr:hypothetical protein CJF30_00010063 [Rutstroemia sp. NJR-2017a BBW]